MVDQSALQHYPTPDWLANLAAGRFKRSFGRMLDACSGSGALASAWTRRFDRNLSRSASHQWPIDAIEIDVRHHATLREKRFNVVGLDFMAFEGGAMYSHVLMNPPFAQGARFALKAWDMLWTGEVVAILNAETIRNPFSDERKHLVKLIEAHGSVEFFTGAFEGPDVEREAEVEVALVYLEKPPGTSKDWIGPIVDRLEKDSNQAEHGGAEFRLPNELALPNDFIKNQCIVFRQAVRAMREAVLTEAAAAHFAARIGATLSERDAGRGGLHKPAPPADYGIPRVYRERYMELKDRAWASVLSSTDALTRLSSSVHKQALSQFEEIKLLEFNESNVYSFFMGLIQSQPDMLMQMCEDVFDTIGRYHSENVAYYRGWKSNTKHRTAGMRLKSTRFILPGFAMESHQHQMDHRKLQTLADFDKVFAMLDGKSAPEVPLVKVFSESLGALRQGERLPASYFDVRYHPGIGTIHFFPRSTELMDRLNRLVGQRRAWLPPPQETGLDALWSAYELAEKMDAKVRKTVAAAHKEMCAAHPRMSYRFRNEPLSCAMSEDEDAMKAQSLLMDGIESVLADAGLLARIETQEAACAMRRVTGQATGQVSDVLLIGSNEEVLA